MKTITTTTYHYDERERLFKTVAITEDVESITAVNEVARFPVEGEYIKIVKRGSHCPELVIGDIHRVTYVSPEGHYFETNIGNGFDVSDDGQYVILEGYTP